MSASTITVDDITNTLAELVSQKKEIDISTLTLEDTLKSLEIDSFSFLELIFEIEYKYDIKFPNEFGDLRSLRDVVNLTYSLIQAKSQSIAA